MQRRNPSLPGIFLVKEGEGWRVAMLFLILEPSSCYSGHAGRIVCLAWLHSVGSEDVQNGTLISGRSVTWALGMTIIIIQEFEWVYEIWGVIEANTDTAPRKKFLMTIKLVDSPGICICEKQAPLERSQISTKNALRLCWMRQTAKTSSPSLDSNIDGTHCGRG